MNADANIAEFVASLEWSEVPADVARKAQDHVIDALGVICAGLAAPASPMVRGYMSELGGAPEASVIGCATALPAPNAAFVNAFHGRIHTFDDTYEAGPVHAGTVVLAAVLAAAERTHASGTDLLAGLLAGHEVSVRVASALGPGHYGSGFHCTGTSNAIGAAAGVARVLRLGAAGVAGALGHAGGGASGLRQFIESGSMTDSALNGARAAQTGVTAALLTARGLPGPTVILTGRFGVLSVLATDADPSRLDAGLGKDWMYRETGLKPFPTCRFTHGPIAEVLELRRRHQLDPVSVEAVYVDACHQSVVTSDRPKVETRFDALMGHQFGIAAALANGRVGMESLEPAVIGDAMVRELTPRVHVRHEADFDAAYPARWRHRIRIVLKDGRELDADSPHPPGDAAAPLDAEVLLGKYRDLAVPVLGNAGAERLRAAASSLETLQDVAELGPLLRG
ncbi:MAG: MmgE/PrpD family protein [Rhodospirillaceae bacterium]